MQPIEKFHPCKLEWQEMIGAMHHAAIQSRGAGLGSISPGKQPCRGAMVGRTLLLGPKIDKSNESPGGLNSKPDFTGQTGLHKHAWKCLVNLLCTPGHPLHHLNSWCCHRLRREGSNPLQQQIRGGAPFPSACEISKALSSSPTDSIPVRFYDSEPTIMGGWASEGSRRGFWLARSDARRI